METYMPHEMTLEEFEAYIEETQGDKTCSVCKCSKPYSQFYARKQARRYSCCKKCHKRYVAKSETSKRVSKHRTLTMDAYQEMLSQAGGVCMVCGNPDKTKAGKPRELAIDHCHETGMVRGLLCRKCNLAIGFLEDDPARAERVAEYLTMSKAVADVSEMSTLS